MVWSAGETKKVIEKVENKLLSIGFVRLNKRRIVFPFDRNFLGWITFPTRDIENILQVFINVGIHCKSIMKMICNIERKPYRQGYVASYSIPIGMLIPETKVICFEWGNESQIEQEMERLVDIVKRVGVPYMRKISSYKALIENMKKEQTMGGGVPERVAVAYYLEQGLSVSLRYLDYIDDQFTRNSQSGYEKHIKRFRSDFLKYLEKVK